MAKAKDGQLMMYWSKRERDVMYDSGENTHPADRRFLHYRLGCEPVNPLHGFAWHPDEPKYLASFFAELEKRGYDLKTMKFSIEKKKETPAAATLLEGREAAGGKVQLREEVGLPLCWCRACDAKRPPLVRRRDLRMITCPICHNKRCPRADFHDYACTGSNEPNQEPVLIIR